MKLHSSYTYRYFQQIWWKGEILKYNSNRRKANTVSKQYMFCFISKCKGVSQMHIYDTQKTLFNEKKKKRFLHTLTAIICEEWQMNFALQFYQRLILLISAPSNYSNFSLTTSFNKYICIDYNNFVLF